MSMKSEIQRPAGQARASGGPMNVLLLSWNFPPAVGGIEYVVENLFRGLRHKGHEVRVVTSHAAGEPREDGVFRAPLPGIAAYVAYSVLKGWALCLRGKPDVLLCGSVVGAPAAWLLSRLFRRPYVVIVHGSDVLHPGAIYQKSVRFLYRRADRLCANSRHTQSLLEQIGVSPARIDVIHPGVRAELFARAPEKGAEEVLESTKGKRVLLYVGRLVRRKGLLEFIEHVMPALVQAHPEVMLVVVGEDATASLIHRRESTRERIDAKVRELGLAQNVKMVRHLPDTDLVRLYFRADILVLPCLDIPGDVEGFGIVFSEAALAGVPAVSTHVGGVPDAVEDGATGVLAEPGDWDGLRRAVTNLLENETLRRRMGEAAAARARRLFDWPVIVSMYEECLRHAASRKDVNTP